MKKVLIIYDTQFGNTRKLGLEIVKGIQENEDITCKVANGNVFDTEDLSMYDAILFGGPTRAFRATRGALNALKIAAQIGIDGKVVTTFGTYMMGKQSRGVKAMDKNLRKSAPGAILISPGFSAKVDSIRGPITESEIPKAHEFGRKLGQEILKHALQSVEVHSA
jgi:flavodoxin